MVLLGGIVIDRIRDRADSSVGVLCLLGAVLTAATGCSGLMAALRLVFGSGPSRSSWRHDRARAWFRGKELSFVLRVNSRSPGLGSLRRAQFSDRAKALRGLAGPLLIATAFGTFCVIGAVAYGSLERGATGCTTRGGGARRTKVAPRDLFGFAAYWLVVACA